MVSALSFRCRQSVERLYPTSILPLQRGGRKIGEALFEAAVAAFAGFVAGLGSRVIFEQVVDALGFG